MIALHGYLTAKEYDAIQLKHPMVQKLLPYYYPVFQGHNASVNIVKLF